MSDEQELQQQQAEGQELRMRIFSGDLVELPIQEAILENFLPPGYDGSSIFALVWPPLEERRAEGDQINLQITPYHIYYGALRALAESAEEERSEALRNLITHLNPSAGLEVCELARGYLTSDLSTALLHYELALEIDDRLYEAYQDGGMCHLAAADLNPHEEAEHLDEAARLFQTATEINPGAGLSWWSRARVAWMQGDEETAHSLLETFLRDYPEGDSRDIVQHALDHGFEEIAPEMQAAQEEQLFDQAQALAFGADPARAAIMLKPLAESHPETGEIWFVLGAALRRSGDAPEAERCLRRAARLIPTEPFIWTELGLTCEEMGQLPAAETALVRALEFDPDNVLCLCTLSRVQFKLGDREGARDAAERAQTLIPDAPEVAEALARLEG